VKNRRAIICTLGGNTRERRIPAPLHHSGLSQSGAGYTTFLRRFPPIWRRAVRAFADSDRIIAGGARGTRVVNNMENRWSWYEGDARSPSLPSPASAPRRPEGERVERSARTREKEYGNGGNGGNGVALERGGDRKGEGGRRCETATSPVHAAGDLSRHISK